MLIGIPKETKTFEYRVSMTPAGVRHLKDEGHEILVEEGAGSASGFLNREYRKAGARIMTDRNALYARSDLILKVKEPQKAEYRFFRPGLIYFTFLHLAAEPALTHALLKKRVTAMGYETVEDANGRLPLLAPMSEIAGLMTPLVGANYLRKDMGGKGTLLASVGMGGTGHVTVIGAGYAGSQAVKIAHGLGASVSVFDIHRQKVESLGANYSERFQVVETAADLPDVIRTTDLLIGAVLVPGKRTPIVVTRSMIQSMEKGSVVMDIAVDQGGCIETIRPTTLKNPVYEQYGILHYGVTNIPSLVPRTATEALSRATLPYVLKIARHGLKEALTMDAGLAKGLNLDDGKILHSALR